MQGQMATQKGNDSNKWSSYSKKDKILTIRTTFPHQMSYSTFPLAWWNLQFVQHIKSVILLFHSQMSDSTFPFTWWYCTFNSSRYIFAQIIWHVRTCQYQILKYFWNHGWRAFSQLLAQLRRSLWREAP
jgi:hypothetical protein